MMGHNKIMFLRSNMENYLQIIPVTHSYLEHRLQCNAMSWSLHPCSVNFVLIHFHSDTSSKSKMNE